MKSPPQPFEMLYAAFRDMPDLQLALLAVLLVFFVVANNAVFALHYRRVGKPVMRSLLNLTSFPLLDFNGLEWLCLICVLVVSMGIGLSAVYLG